MSQDPTTRVASQVLPHIHLVADFAYPHIQSAHQQFILDELQKAPRIADNTAFSWQFLDGPPDGTVLLVYHPPQRVNVWASDGYAWMPEQYLRHTYGPFVIEMFQAINGYNTNFEPRAGPAVHSRQRYRLVTDPHSPSKQGDPSLWLVHYRRSERMEQASRIPMMQAEMQSMQARAYLKNLGHLQEKKFMLADVQNWPAVTMPQEAHQHNALTFVGGAQMASRMQMHLAQQQAYSRDHGPSPKRPRHSTNTSQRSAPVQQAVPHVDDEEDIAESDRRDVFDILTQRDISVMRFKNHEEWMEELFSGYATDDIKPVDLQFDRVGFMQPITDGFFHRPDRLPTPPHESWKNTSEHYNSITAKPFEQGETKRFAQVVEKRIAENNAQIAEMKRLHEEHLKKLGQGSILREAAARIRGEQQNAHQNAKNNEDSSTPSNDTRSAATPSANEPQSAEDVAKHVQSVLGKQIVPRHEIHLLQKGGLVQETTPLTKSTTANATGDNMASLFDDFLEPGDSGEISAKPSASPQLPTTTDTAAPAPQGDDWVMVQKPSDQEMPREAPQPSNPEPASDMDHDLIDFGALPGDDEAHGTGDANLNSGGGAFDDAMHFDTIDSVAGGTPTFDGAGDSSLAMPGSDLAGQAANPFAESADAAAMGGSNDTPDGAMDLMNDSAFDDAFNGGDMDADPSAAT